MARFFIHPCFLWLVSKMSLYEKLFLISVNFGICGNDLFLQRRFVLLVASLSSPGFLNMFLLGFLPERFRRNTHLSARANGQFATK